ncbi:DUF4429 domain-containing protein [Planotetraspora sp. GP83]|uniref:DUF4429 domain-containing protein n=1 Tax=Planotetraspora sp. GP83 TaxID=3156264 RepID=UPI0035194E85
MSRVELRPTSGWRGHGELRVITRPGADPYRAIVEGHLPDRFDPFRLHFTKKQELLAEYYATEITTAAGNEPSTSPIPTPPPPIAIDSTAGGIHFDGAYVQRTKHSRTARHEHPPASGNRANGPMPRAGQPNRKHNRTGRRREHTWGRPGEAPRLAIPD